MFRPGSRFIVDERIYISVGWVDQVHSDDIFFIAEQNIEGIFVEENIATAKEARVLLCFQHDESKDFYLCEIRKEGGQPKRLTRLCVESEMIKLLLKLCADKAFKLALKSLQGKEDQKCDLSFDIYLTKKLNKEIMSTYPADNYRNVHAKEINSVLSHFFFKENSPLKTLSNIFGEANDCTILAEDDKSEHRSSHELLFELIYRLNNKFNASNDMEIDIIQERSCLLPLLRPYQINAVKWMLYKENFDFSKLDHNGLQELSHVSIIF